MKLDGLHPKFMVYRWELPKQGRIFCVGEIRKAQSFFGPSVARVLLALVELILFYF